MLFFFYFDINKEQKASFINNILKFFKNICLNSISYKISTNKFWLLILIKYKILLLFKKISAHIKYFYIIYKYEILIIYLKLIL